MSSKTKNLNYIAIGNSELKNQPDVFKGMKILHQHENGEWEEAKIEYGKKVNADNSKEESGLLGFYTLKNGTAYLGAVNGKLINRANLKLANF